MVSEAWKRGSLQDRTSLSPFCRSAVGSVAGTVSPFFVSECLMYAVRRARMLFVYYALGWLEVARPDAVLNQSDTEIYPSLKGCAFYMMLSTLGRDHLTNVQR